MEFEDYEDIFTFEEWSFSHQSSSASDEKTFDELCEEVLKLCEACDKKINIESDLRPKARTEVSQRREEMSKKFENFCNGTSSSTTSDTSLIRSSSDHLHGLQMTSENLSPVIPEDGENAKDSVLRSPDKCKDAAPPSPGKIHFPEKHSNKEDESQTKEMSNENEEPHLQTALESVNSTSEKPIKNDSFIDASPKIDLSIDKTKKALARNPTKRRSLCDTGHTISEPSTKIMQDVTVPKVSNIACQITVTQKQDTPNRDQILTVQQVTSESLKKQRKFLIRTKKFHTEERDKSMPNTSESTKEHIESHETKSFTEINDPHSAEKRKSNTLEKTMEKSPDKSGQFSHVSSTKRMSPDSSSDYKDKHCSIINHVLFHDIAKPVAATGGTLKSLSSTKISNQTLPIPRTRSQSRVLLTSNTSVRITTDPKERKSGKSTDTTIHINPETSSRKTINTSKSEIVPKLPEIEIQTEEIDSSTQYEKMDNESKKVLINRINEEKNALSNSKSKIEQSNKNQDQSNSTMGKQSVKEEITIGCFGKNDRVMIIPSNSSVNISFTTSINVGSDNHLIRETNPSKSIKSFSMAPRGSLQPGIDRTNVSQEKPQNVSQESTAAAHSENCASTLITCPSITKQNIIDIPTASNEHTRSTITTDLSNNDGSTIGIITRVRRTRPLRDYTRKPNAKLSLSIGKLYPENGMKGDPLNTKATDELSEHKNSTKDVLKEEKYYSPDVFLGLSTAPHDTAIKGKSVEVVQDQLVKKLKIPQQELKRNDELSSEGSKTAVGKNTSTMNIDAPASTVSEVNIQETEDTNKRFIISPQRRSAARVIPYSKIVASGFCLESFYPLRDSHMDTFPASKFSAHKEPICVPPKASLSESVLNASEDDEQIVVTESDDQSECLNKNNDANCSSVASQGKDKLAPETYSTQLSFSKSGNLSRKRPAEANDDQEVPTSKKVKMEPCDISDSKCLTTQLKIDSKSLKTDVGNIDVLQPCSKMAISNPTDTASLFISKSHQNLKNNSTVLNDCAEVNITEKMTHCVKNGDNQTVKRVSNAQACDNIKNTNTKQEIASVVTVSPTPSNIFDDETMKSVFDTEKKEISSRLTEKTRTETPQGIMQGDLVRNFRPSSNTSKINITRRRNSETQVTTLLSPRKSKADSLRSPARCLRKSLTTSKGIKCESGIKKSIQEMPSSIIRNTDNLIRLRKSTSDASSKSQHEVPSRVQQPVPSRAGQERQCPPLPSESIAARGAEPVQRMLRRLRRPTVPGPASTSEPSPLTSARILRQRVRHPTHPAAPARPAP